MKASHSESDLRPPASSAVAANIVCVGDTHGSTQERRQRHKQAQTHNLMHYCCGRNSVCMYVYVRVSASACMALPVSVFTPVSCAQEAGNVLDEMTSESQKAATAKGEAAKPVSSMRTRVQAQVAYGLAECLAFRGAFKMAGHSFALAASSAAKSLQAGGGGAVAGSGFQGKDSASGVPLGAHEDSGGAVIWGGDVKRLRLEALDRAARFILNPKP